jgi:hypothetical protein
MFGSHEQPIGFALVYEPSGIGNGQVLVAIATLANLARTLVNATVHAD